MQNVNCVYGKCKIALREKGAEKGNLIDTSRGVTGDPETVFPSAGGVRNPDFKRPRALPFYDHVPRFCQRFRAVPSILTTVQSTAFKLCVQIADIHINTTKVLSITHTQNYFYGNFQRC